MNMFDHPRVKSGEHIYLGKCVCSSCGFKHDLFHLGIVDVSWRLDAPCDLSLIKETTSKKVYGLYCKLCGAVSEVVYKKSLFGKGRYMPTGTMFDTSSWSEERWLSFSEVAYRQRWVLQELAKYKRDSTAENYEILGDWLQNRSRVKRHPFREISEDFKSLGEGLEKEIRKKNSTKEEML